MKKILLMVLAACMMLAAGFAALFMAQPQEVKAAGSLYSTMQFKVDTVFSDAKVVRWNVIAYNSPNTTDAAYKVWDSERTVSDGSVGDGTVIQQHVGYHNIGDSSGQYVVLYIVIYAWDDYGFSYSYGFAPTYNMQTQVWTFTGGVQTYFGNNGSGNYLSTSVPELKANSNDGNIASNTCTVNLTGIPKGATVSAALSNGKQINVTQTAETGKLAVSVPRGNSAITFTASYFNGGRSCTKSASVTPNAATATA